MMYTFTAFFCFSLNKVTIVVCDIVKYWLKSKTYHFWDLSFHRKGLPRAKLQSAWDPWVEVQIRFPPCKTINAELLIILISFVGFWLNINYYISQKYSVTKRFMNTILRKYYKCSEFKYFLSCPSSSISDNKKKRYKVLVLNHSF